jgi:predicted amidohydrolase YtcJ
MTEGAADLVVAGGTIRTCGDAYPPAAALAVRGDRFAYVGSTQGAMALRGPATRVLDVSGLTVLPGLIDAHLHLTSLGLRLHQAKLGGADSFDEVIERTLVFAGERSDEWIVGRGWDETRWPDKSLPVHDRLSAAFPDRPVVLTRVDGHALVANARAMTIAGVDAATPDPAGGRILRDAAGRPTGIFVDAAQALIDDRVPKPTHHELMRAVRAAIAECNRWGVTGVAEPGCDDAALAAQIELIERGEFTLRNYAMLYDDAPLIEAHARDGLLDGAYDGRLWVRAIKAYADGALGSRGAALLAPYSDDPGNGGLVVTPRARIEAVSKSALRSGFQMCVHAIGDRANRIVLDAYEKTLKHRGTRDPRFRIEHAQLVASQDVPRFARLGVIASMQTAHALSDLSWAASRIGPRRLSEAYAWRSLLDAGAIVANGTDAPVEPVSTARTFYAAVTRGGHPGQCMTRGEALASMTTQAAYANFQEGVTGSIAPGKYADFVVMDRDWMTVAPEAILGTRIVGTYFGGRCVYDAQDAAA